MEETIKIPIKNIYYMLAYAWDFDNYIDETFCSDEEFDNVCNLLAKMLVKEVSNLIRRGLTRGYVENTEIISKLKGQINLTDSMNQMTYLKKKMLCTYDTFSSNILFNQIIKSTMLNFLKFKELNNSLKISINKLLASFNDVSEIRITKYHFSLLRFNRNNINYRIIINVCALFNEGLILNEDNGKIKISSFIKDAQMCAIYEKFILNFYKCKCKQYKVYNPKLKWDATDIQGENLLPDMQTDIVLENNKTNEQLIIDAKFYKNTFVSKYDNSADKIRSNHIYQILAYVDMSPYDGKISGLLLYPTIYKEVDSSAKLHGKYDLYARTLNLNTSWEIIYKRLMEIAQIIS